jgi:WD40 repeat protein
MIVDAEGQQQKVIPGENRWYSISRWLDNQRIVIRETGKITKESIVIDVFSGVRQKLPPLPSDINNMFPPPDGSMISYDPSTTYVVYPDNNFQTILENLNTHYILARVETVWESVPRWSPDGQHFIIASQVFSGTVPIDYDLYSIDLQGEIQRLTYLSQDQNYIERTSYYWSPNGQYIAMWVITDSKQKNISTLVVLDTHTKNLMNYCITNRRMSKFPPPLIWSPDSQQLLMGISDNVDDNINYTIVVDIHQNLAVKIVENLTPVGWLVSP